MTFMQRAMSLILTATTAPLETAKDPEYNILDVGDGNLWWYLFAVAIVVAAAYFCSRWLARRQAGVRSGGVMQVVDRVNIDKGSGIVLLRIAEQLYLVAVTPAGAILLDKLDPDVVEAASYQAETGSPQPFRSVIDASLRRMGVQPRQAPPAVSDDEDISAQSLGELERLMSQRSKRMAQKQRSGRDWDNT